MRYTRDQLKTWLRGLDRLRDELRDELMWLEIEESLRALAQNDDQESVRGGAVMSDRTMVSRAVRLLMIYDALATGQVLVKREAAELYGVDVRTIQRDFDDIRAYLSEEEDRRRELVYDRRKLGYVIVEKTI